VAEARLRKADVIVCAMKGVAKAFRKIFGSTTSALIHKSDIPLIVVPEKAVFNIPNNIALASDLDPETSASTLELLKVIGEKFTSGLSVVWVVGEDFDAENEMRYRPSEFIKGLRGLNPVFEFPKGGSVTKVLEDFIRKNNVAMLAMIPHKHDFMERFFTESITKKMIFHSDIPLLVLPQKKILKGNEELVNDVSEIKNE
jgi:nucleotide-binding universal stress UspA family protein